MIETNENVTTGNKSNGLGTAGFIVAIVAIVLCWIPTLGWILGAIALILSAVGMTKKPKGLAIAGLIIALIAVVIGIYISYQAAQAVAELQNVFENSLDAYSDSLNQLESF